jgi:hypothetical protein
VGRRRRTRDVGPGVSDRPATARPRPESQGFVLGGAVQGERQADTAGARGNRPRRGAAST